MLRLFLGGAKICNKIFRIGVPPPFSEKSSFSPQNYQKVLVYNTKICNEIFWIGNDPPPLLEVFRKLIHFCEHNCPLPKVATSCHLLDKTSIRTKCLLIFSHLPDETSIRTICFGTKCLPDEMSIRTKRQLAVITPNNALWQCGTFALCSDSH